MICSTKRAETLERSGSETPRLDAELLLGHAVSAGRTTLLAAPEAVVSDGQADRFRELVERRARGEPVAYIRGIKEFYGIALTVDPRALIPRPETEVLVDLGLERIKHLLVDEPRPSDERGASGVGRGHRQRRDLRCPGR